MTDTVTGTVTENIAGHDPENGSFDGHLHGKDGFAGQGRRTGEKRGRGITGTGLKLIAVITMLLDHIGGCILEPYCTNRIPAELVGNPGALAAWMTANRDVAVVNLTMILLRLIGRFAFPIFVFLLVEGFTHTRNVWKYALNLLIFGLIAEIPFNLAHSGYVLLAEYQSVYFTLFMGLLCIYVISLIEKIRAWYAFPLMMAAVGMFGAAAHFLRTDYAATGVLTIAVMYIFREKRKLAFGLGCFVLMISSPLEIVALFMLIPIARYNGERGMKVSKYLFYAFYPVHLAVLYLIALLLGIRSFGLMEKAPEARPAPAPSASVETVMPEARLNYRDTTNVPTAIVKIGDDYFIDDCYNDQIIYNDNLTDPLATWKILADPESCGLSQSHTLAGDGRGNILADDTENDRVLVFEPRGEGYELTRVFENIGDRPHYTVYHEGSDSFFVLSSCSGELFTFKHDRDGKIVRGEVHTFEELKHLYVRSFTIDGDSILFVSGLAADADNTQPPAILEYDLETFEKRAEYPVPDSLAGMVEIAKSGKYYYITVSTDINGDQDKATIIETRELAGLQNGLYEDIYAKVFEPGGTPYYLGTMDGEWYMTEHRHDRIWKIETDEWGRFTQAKVIY